MTTAANLGVPTTAPNIIMVEQGKVLDYIDGITQRLDTPEEYVRQEISKSLVREYGYPKADIAVEVPLKLGSRRPRADIVVFPTGLRHEQSSAYIIVECKAQTVKSGDRKEGVQQLESYLASCPNATYGMWTNGLERFCYKMVTEEGLRKAIEIPDIPSYGQTEEDAERPTVDQLKAASSDALLFTFRRCHNYIAGNQGLQKPEAFWELLKIIFCKIRDERGDEVTFYATSKERKGMNGQIKVRDRLERLFAAVKSEYPAIFPAAEGINLDPSVLAYIVTQLQMYSLLESDVDVKGHAYEEIVGSNLRGDRGEFFTPRNICTMAVKMLNPKEGQTVLDPACGTGGFLVTAMNHVIETIRENESIKERKRHPTEPSQDRIELQTRERARIYASKHVFGLDFNPNLVKATKMNMVMNNDGSGGLFQANSLARPVTWDESLRNQNLIGRIDIVFSNPPFGSKIPVDDPVILEQYDLGHIWEYDVDSDMWAKTDRLQKSQPPEILFIERCVQFLKPGSGRAAIVLPDGILGSPGMGYVREWILTHTRVLASIDLHPDTFQPNVSVQTSVLILERKTDEQVRLEIAAGQKNDYNVFMAVADRVGHDKRGNVLYVRDEQGNEIAEEYDEPYIDRDDAGRKIVGTRRGLRKRLDDNTLDIVEVFRSWLKEQD